MGLEVIGVDNGYGFTKTAHRTFVTSIAECREKPGESARVLCYDGKYYGVGTTHVAPERDKTEDQKTFLLTLVAMAQELQHRGLTAADAVLAVGMPLEYCAGERKERFHQYFAQHTVIDYEYEGIPYHINLRRVYVFPQCATGIQPYILKGKVEAPSVVIDIGSYTTEILHLSKNDRGMVIPIIAESSTIQYGTLHCLKKCQNALDKQFGNGLRDEQIQNIFKGMENVTVANREELVKQTAREYMKDLYRAVRDQGFDLETLPTFMMGGGASFAKRFGDQQFYKVTFMMDIKVNAVGYETVANALLRNEGLL